MTARLLALLALLSLPLSAQGALVQQDRLTPGDGEMTLDTATGLLWLDLPLSKPVAITSSNAFTADGWTVATLAQVQTLISNQFGSSVTDGGRQTVNAADAQAFVDLFGVTYGQDSWGRFRSTTSGRAGDLNVRADASFGSYSYLIHNNSFADGLPHSFSGVMYVKSAAVPEPGAVGLVISGLLGVVGFARRRRAA